jgi:hypothetical protein
MAMRKASVREVPIGTMGGAPSAGPAARAERSPRGPTPAPSRPPAGDQQPAGGAARAGRRGSSRRERDARRERAVLDAEVRRLMRELRYAGPLRRDVLARRCHASAWKSGSFVGAVQAGVRDGSLRELPFGFVAVSRSGAPRRGGATGGEGAAAAKDSDG